jgi:peroxiredoxin
MMTKLCNSHGSFTEIVLLVLCFVLPVAAIADLTPANSRKPSPDFTLTDSKGASIKLSDYKGKVVLLDFWATWCGGCKVEIPWYIEFQNTYKDKGLSVVGVSMDDDGWKSVKPFLAENKINYPIVIGNSDLGTQFGLSGLPLTLLIDRNGKIADSHAGMVEKDAFEREIQSLLKDPVLR